MAVGRVGSSGCACGRTMGCRSASSLLRRFLRHPKPCALLLLGAGVSLMLYSCVIHYQPGPDPPVYKYNVTLVTAFLDIGDFGKGKPNKVRHGDEYLRWSTSFSHLLNPVVLYTNSDTFARHFLHVRRDQLNVTTIVKVSRDALWSFGLRPWVAALYARKDYPKNYPNTVYPDYTCMTHAKFDFLLDAMARDLYPSRHVAWLDVGYFREQVDRWKKSTRLYRILPPTVKPVFDDRRVLFGQVRTPNWTMPYRTVLLKNLNWVAAGFFLATPDVMRTFAYQYRTAVTSFLDLNLSQVEQQMIYAMYTREGRALIHPTVELQIIAGGWFTSGMKCLVPV